MFRPFQLPGKWIVVFNVSLAQSISNSGARSRMSNRSRATFELCWTGDRWRKENGSGGKEFDSEAAANKYIDENDEMLRNKLEEYYVALQN